MSDAVNSDAAGRSVRSVKVGDFLGRRGIEVDSPEDGLSATDTLMRGEFLHQELRRGLFLHVGNGREEHAFSVKSQIREGLSCVFFLEGHVDLKIGDRGFSFRGTDDGYAQGTTIVSSREDSFERRSHAAQSLRHLVVSASPEWLGLDGGREIGGHSRLESVLKDHLNTYRWTITPRMLEIVRQAASPSGLVPELRNLYLEGRAIEIIGEALSTLLKTDRTAAGSDLRDRRDMLRLERAKEFIAANLAASLTVERIAREAGHNSTGLQDIFRSVEGVTIFEYVRLERLKRALALLRSGECSVAQASLVAGYSSPNNFTTAFRRAFGLSPREALASGKALPGRL